MRSLGRHIAGVALVALVIGATASAGAVTRFPVIGCDSPKYPYANHYGWMYRPAGFCRTRRGSGVEGIDHTRWHGWGAKQATGRGDLVVYDGAVEELPATITAYGFWSTHHFAGGDEYVSTYRYLRVHVVSPRWHGARTVTLDVQIQE